MDGIGVGYAARKKAQRRNRGEITRTAKVYPSEEASRLLPNRKSDYRRCLVITVTDPAMIRVGLPEHFIEEDGQIKPVYQNQTKGRTGTYVLEKPTQATVNGLSAKSGNRNISTVNEQEPEPYFVRNR
jgi:hypothetical protein